MDGLWSIGHRNGEDRFQVRFGDHHSTPCSVNEEKISFPCFLCQRVIPLTEWLVSFHSRFEENFSSIEGHRRTDNFALGIHSLTDKKEAKSRREENSYAKQEAISRVLFDVT